MNKSSYESLGASASKAGLHQVLDQAGLSEDDGLFAKISSDLAGDPNYCSVVHCDGAGTKCILAYLWYVETGDPSLFAGLAQDALVMNLDDVYCIGTPESLLLANAIARNASVINDEMIGAIISSYKRLIEQYRELGIPIEMSGGETADCGDTVRTIVVDAVLTGRIARAKLIRAKNIAPGNIIIGLSSTGKASYEQRANSGIASNGLTLARHSLLSHYYYQKFPEVADPRIDPKIVYRGPYRVTDTPKELDSSVGEALLSPTRSYAPLLHKLYEELGSEISGVIHNTGGALTKVLRFGTGNLYIKDNLFEIPPIFSLIQKHGKVDWKEMYQVFNMGQRIEIYLDPKHEQSVLDIASSFSIEAKRIGHVEANDNNSSNCVQLKTPQGVFEYGLS